MTDMTGNPYWPGEHLLNTPDDRSIPAMLAALTYEQRTANLMAFHAAIPGNAMDRQSRKLRASIMDRLGLGSDS